MLRGGRREALAGAGPAGRELFDPCAAWVDGIAMGAVAAAPEAGGAASRSGGALAGCALDWSAGAGAVAGSAGAVCPPPVVSVGAPGGPPSVLVVGCRGSERDSEGPVEEGPDAWREGRGADAGKAPCGCTSIGASSLPVTAGGLGSGDMPSSCLHRLAGRMEPFFAAYRPHALHRGSWSFLSFLQNGVQSVPQFLQTCSTTDCAVDVRQIEVQKTKVRKHQNVAQSVELLTHSRSRHTLCSPPFSMLDFPASELTVLCGCMPSSCVQPSESGMGAVCMLPPSSEPATGG